MGIFCIYLLGGVKQYKECILGIRLPRIFVKILGFSRV